MLTERTRLNTMVGIVLTGISRAALAKRAGIGLNTLNRFLRGEGGLTLDKAGKLCAALEYEPAEFFGTELIIHIKEGQRNYEVIGRRELSDWDSYAERSRRWDAHSDLGQAIRSSGRFIDDNPRRSLAEITANLHKALGGEE